MLRSTHNFWPISLNFRQSMPCAESRASHTFRCVPLSQSIKCKSEKWCVQISSEIRFVIHIDHWRCPRNAICVWRKSPPIQRANYSVNLELTTNDRSYGAEINKFQAKIRTFHAPHKQRQRNTTKPFHVTGYNSFLSREKNTNDLLIGSVKWWRPGERRKSTEARI